MNRPQNRAMSWTALALVLGAALLHAAWNIAAKKSGGGDAFMLMGALMVGVLWAPLALWVGWHELWTWGPPQWAFVLATTLVHLLYYRSLLAGYRHADLTVVYPVARGTGPLLTVLAAVLLLGERPGLLGALGVAGVCGGVFVLAGGPRLLRPAADAAQRARLLTGVRWGALTGVFIAGYSVLDGYAVKVMLLSPILLDWLTNLLRVPFLLPGQLRDRAGFVAACRSQWRYALIGAVFGPVAYVMVLYALTMAPMSLVSPAREVSLLFAALIGGQLLGEGGRALRLAGAACIAGGVALLAMA